MTKRTDEHIRREAEGVCYTVWIEVEKQDPDNDVYQTEPVDFGSTATFTTYEEAEAYARQMHESFAKAPHDVTPL